MNPTSETPPTRPVSPAGWPLPDVLRLRFARTPEPAAGAERPGSSNGSTLGVTVRQKEVVMSELDWMGAHQLELSFDPEPVSESELATAVFLARYSGRTRESYRAICAACSNGQIDVGLDPLEA